MLDEISHVCLALFAAGRWGSSLLVGVCMVDIVLDPPGLKGVDEGRKHEGTHYVL